MAEHLQLRGVRNQLDERGINLSRDEYGNYTLSHKDNRHTQTEVRGDLTFAHIAGLRMASERDAINKAAWRRV
jgi:hypothetical protein